jgi:TolB-like protein
MISWSSSSRGGSGAWLAGAIALASLAACRHGAPSGPEPLKLAVFPVQNASGGKAPIRLLTEALDAALAARGLEVVPRPELDAVLARHRIRFTGGVDRTLAKVLREELGVDAMVVPTLELYAEGPPPKISLTARIANTADRPVVLWADHVARSGDDSPGLLGLGLVSKATELENAVVAEVAASVDRWGTRRARGESCGRAGRFKPRRSFRAPVLDDVGRRSIVVLPFQNETSRRSAGDVVVGQFVAQLARSGKFEVLDPGVVREELLGHRIVLEGGVSIDQAMAVLDLLRADLVVSGDVQVFESPTGKQAPRVEFTAYVIDRRTSELVWSSFSSATGADRVFFFDAGKVHTATGLSCRMVRGVVDRIVGRRPPVDGAEANSTHSPANVARSADGGAASSARPEPIQRNFGRFAPSSRRTEPRHVP